MSKQIGTLLVSGDIGNIGFFQKKGKAYARKRTTVDARRYAKDPAFDRSRENNAEFANAANAAKALRESVRPFLAHLRDDTSYNRLHSVMSQVKNADLTSSRGNRNVASGIASAAGKQALRDFNFNAGAILGRVLYKQQELDTATGIITIQNLLPLEDVAFPLGATHMSVKGCWSRVGFATGEQETAFTNVVSLAKQSLTPINVTLTPTGIPTITGTDFFLLMVSFYQEMNGVQYAIKNGSFNALCILDVV